MFSRQAQMLLWRPDSVSYTKRPPLQCNRIIPHNSLNPLNSTTSTFRMYIIIIIIPMTTYIIDLCLLCSECKLSVVRTHLSKVKMISVDIVIIISKHDFRSPAIIEMMMMVMIMKRIMVKKMKEDGDIDNEW